MTERSPESLGWVRRPDLDTNGGICWQMPDGNLVLHPRGQPVWATALMVDDE